MIFLKENKCKMWIQLASTSELPKYKQWTDHDSETTFTWILERSRRLSWGKILIFLMIITSWLRTLCSWSRLFRMRVMTMLWMNRESDNIPDAAKNEGLNKLTKCSLSVFVKSTFIPHETDLMMTNISK